MRWDLFCRVVDNFGDIGVCWRLASDLASRGEAVRLWTDDASALAWMAPHGAGDVSVHAFDAAGLAGTVPGDVVVEAFGCDVPTAFARAIASAGSVWINLEYLSAEPYVERSHGLPSPQPGGLVKWFFFPGFSARTGGLLRERRLLAEHATFDRHRWLASIGVQVLPGERVVSLFCYENPAVPALLQALAGTPTLLLLTPGFAQRQVASTPQGVRTAALPWLEQAAYDRLLWSCDLNFVRGEDSLVRAIWAGVPFVWQPYPQHDGAHRHKLLALLTLLAVPVPTPPVPVPGLAALWLEWSGLQPLPSPALQLPETSHGSAWWRASRAFRQRLALLPDLTTALLAFAAAKRRQRWPRKTEHSVKWRLCDNPTGEEPGKAGRP